MEDSLSLTARSKVPVEETWDLTVLFPDLASWEALFTKLEGKYQYIEELKGTLADSPSQIKTAFQYYLDLNREVETLYTYAHLLSDADTSDSASLALLDRSVNLFTRISTASSFLIPELLAIEPEKLVAFLADPVLDPLRRMLNEIVRFRPHTLSSAEESLLAAGTEAFRAPQLVFSQLNNADFTFGFVEVEGENLPLSHGSFSLFLKSQQRSIRQEAFEKYYAVFDSHKNGLAALLSSSVKKDLYLAKARCFTDTREQSLFRDEIPVSVYDNLITTVTNNIDPLHRYYTLRKELLSLGSVRLYDTYLPLVPKVDTKISYQEACEIIVAALSPLGKEYCSVLADGLTSARWVDRYENKAKRSGAYASGCYDSNPYILLNYKDEDINSLFTLAHEAGHAMHSYFSRKHQPYQDHDYTIFVAEVASIFNEQLLSSYLQRKYHNDPLMFAYLINHQLDDIKATFFRQTMFAEFERSIHQAARENISLTVDYLRETYSSLLTRYFGPAVEIQPIDSLECLRIPHFYSSFYVYKYATGLAAAVDLAQKVLRKEDSAEYKYLDFLKSGCRKPPLGLLLDAGVDMISEKPLEAVIQLFAVLTEKLNNALSNNINEKTIKESAL